MNEKQCNERHKSLAEKLESMGKERKHDKNTMDSKYSALLERHLRLERDAYDSQITMKKDIEFIKEGMTELKNTMEEFIKESPKKFASKRVEVIVFGMVGVILLAVLAQILKEIIK